MNTPPPSIVWKTFLQGLVVVAPVALTLAIVYWLGASLEHALGALLRLFLEPDRYVTGMGIAVGIALTFAAGFAMRIWAARRLLDFAEDLLERIPLANTVYGGIRDLMRFVSSMSGAKGVDHVVLVTLADGVQVIGFVTDDSGGIDVGPDESGDERVPVYLQLSYQIGGYTVFVPRSRIEPLDVGIEEAMRWVLTAGVSSDGARRTRNAETRASG